MEMGCVLVRSVTSTVLVPPAVPPITTSLPVKPLTDSLKTAVKVMGAVLVGSACPAAWLIVTVGGVGSNVTVLSVLVEAVVPFPAASVAPPARLAAVNVAAVGQPPPGRSVVSLLGSRSAAALSPPPLGAAPPCHRSRHHSQ